MQGGHLELVKLLIQKGSNVSAETKARKKPIDLAKDDHVCMVLTTSGELLKGHIGSQITQSHGASASNDTEGEQKNSLTEEMSGVAEEDVDNEKGGHREREEEETKELIGPQPKKAKVALKLSGW